LKDKLKARTADDVLEDIANTGLRRYKELERLSNNREE